MLNRLALPCMADVPLCLPYLPSREARTVGTRITPDCPPFVAEERLEADGWRFLGSGLFCRAFLSPDGERVVKIGTGKGSRATIDAALAHPDNPHLPTIYGFTELSGSDDYGDDIFAVETEALESLCDHDPDNGDLTGDYGAWTEEWANGGDFYPDGFRDLDDCPDCPMKDAIEALMDARERLTGWSRDWNNVWDIHEGNLMLRASDGAIVLNDLIS